MRAPRAASNAPPPRKLASLPDGLDDETSWYDLVIPRKTAISLPDETFQRVDRAAKQLGLSRSEFFARAAESWFPAIDDDGTTDTINAALRGSQAEHEFTAAAAAALLAADATT